MTKRRHLSRLARVRLFETHKGICCVCGLKIHAERGDRWEPHHVKPLWAGGEDEVSNLAPAHERPCHKNVSASDNTIRAKTDRQRANHLGIPKPRKAKLPAGRDSRDRKKLNGEVVPREARYEKHRRVMEGRVVR